MNMGASQPGRGDLNLAEFQAKLLAGENPYPDPAEDQMHRINRLIFRWAALLTLVAGVLTWTLDAEIAAIGSAVLTLVALLVAWNRVKTRAAKVASLSHQS